MVEHQGFSCRAKVVNGVCDLQNSTRQRKSALCVEDPAPAGGSLQVPAGGSLVGTWIAGDVSPGGTLIRGSDSQKSRNSSNVRSYSKLQTIQSLFSLVKVPVTIVPRTFADYA